MPENDTLKTIKDINENISVIKNILGELSPDSTTDTYGPENEYTWQSLKRGIRAILTDLSGLVKTPNKFIQLSNHSERSNINEHLNSLGRKLANKNYSSAVNHLDELKAQVRIYSPRHSKESHGILEERITKLHAMLSDCEDMMQKIKYISQSTEQSKSSIESANEDFLRFSTKCDELNEKIVELNELQQESKQSFERFNELLTSAKSHEEIINNFSINVEKRQNQLDKQEQSTSEYEEKMKEHEKKVMEYEDEAKGIIKQSRDALQYATAVGISASFSEQYNELKSKERINLGWVVGALSIIATGVVLSIYMFLDEDISTLTIGGSVLRITILSIISYTAWFFASQYVRYKNTLEDYAYKSVLAKSIVAFLDNFSLPDERNEYFKTVLKEIHQDPLRKKHDLKLPITEALKAVKRKNSKDKENENLPSNE